ncbi:PAX-interacting protein 1-like, partial [Melanaphis sacchari]|uniref:PAX-interacting protein 1-like n=1 Tax=Melanaphis sacchari TaxID=742174 RepID=UPI000DC1465F
KMFCCVICNKLIGESTYSTPCGHVYHFKCITEWLNRSPTCPTCRTNVLHNDLIKLFMPEDKRYKITPKEELDSLMKKSQLLEKKSISNAHILNDMKKKLHETQMIDKKYNSEKFRNMLLKQEMYELQSLNLAELNKISNFKREKGHFLKTTNNIQSYLPNTSRVNVCNKNKVTEKIELSKLQLQLKPSTEKGFLSDCHFWIVNEHKELPGGSNRLYFNEQRVMEHGGILAYRYSNEVTHVICNSQKNNEVFRALSDHKKCVTDYWLSDIIGEKKIVEPWLAHHFPIPYSYNNLPCEDYQIAIVNFNKNDHFRVKVMAEIAGACVTNKVSHNTHVVISQNLEGEIIKRALTFKIPVVNVQWISDILLGEKISFHDSNKIKYQQFELCDPFSINAVRVSHLMEFFKENVMSKKK